MRRREFLGWLTAGVASAVTGTVMSGCAKEAPKSDFDKHMDQTKKGIVAGKKPDPQRMTGDFYEIKFGDGSKAKDVIVYKAYRLVLAPDGTFIEWRENGSPIKWKRTS